jgi:CubicO group peptidase (beta-lactamase class C family)
MIQIQGTENEYLELKAALDLHIDKAAYYYDICGLVVSLWRPDFEYARTYGYKNILTKEKIKTDDILHMASITKLFVGIGIMKLEEKGLINIEDNLIKYLPWFVMRDERYKEITIRQLLSHTSGMHDVADYHWDKPENDKDALERYVKSPEVSHGMLKWDPKDNKFSYSNIGYEILGVVIAKISGVTFEEYIKQNIFIPLGMKNSELLTYERDMSQICAPHYKNDKNEVIKAQVFPYSRTHGPSSTLTSNADDIRKWAIANLEKKILKEETYQKMMDVQALIPNNGESICLSWFKREQSGFTLYGHEGADDGFRSSFWMCPELKMYILVNANMSGAQVKKISKMVFDLMLGKKVKL